MHKRRKYLDCFRLLQAGGRGEAPQSERRGERGDEGATLVEMALVSAILFAMLFGLFEMTLAFYTYHYVSEAAREGSRYAIVRGATSCKNTPNLINCNVSEPEIVTYVKSLGYPGIDAANRMDVTVYTFQAGSPGAMTWTSCGEGMTCNQPGDQVQVNVTYHFPLSIPFWTATTLDVHSTSNMAFAQ